MSSSSFLRSFVSPPAAPESACIVVTKSETQLRAITVAYMNSILLKEARMNLLALGQGDYPALAAANRSLISAKQLIALREGLLRKR